MTRLDGYGDARIRLKPEIRERTTVTFGDSGSDQEIPASSARSVSPYSVMAPTYEALLGRYGKRLHEVVTAEVGGYIEAQYHGGIKVTDIQDVAFSKTPPPETIAALEKAGIPWKVLDEAGGKPKAAAAPAKAASLQTIYDEYVQVVADLEVAKQKNAEAFKTTYATKEAEHAAQSTAQAEYNRLFVDKMNAETKYEKAGGPLDAEDRPIPPPGAEPKAADLVDARVKGNESAMQAVEDNDHLQRAVAAAQDAGVEVHVLDHEQATKLWGDQVHKVPASYDFRQDRIFINTKFAGWADPEAALAKAATVGPNGWFSSSEKDHWIRHEVGHAQHRKAIGEAAFAAMKDERPEGARTILREVSAYGSMLKVEFVAETYAGLAAGKSYSQPVMDYFRKLGGVEPGAIGSNGTVAVPLVPKSEPKPLDMVAVKTPKAPSDPEAAIRKLADAMARYDAAMIANDTAAKAALWPELKAAKKEWLKANPGENEFAAVVAYQAAKAAPDPAKASAPPVPPPAAPARATISADALAKIPEVHVFQKIDGLIRELETVKGPAQAKIQKQISALAEEYQDAHGYQTYIDALPKVREYIASGGEMPAPPPEATPEELAAKAAARSERLLRSAFEYEGRWHEQGHKKGDKGEFKEALDAWKSHNPGKDYETELRKLAEEKVAAAPEQSPIHGDFRPVPEEVVDDWAVVHYADWMRKLSTDEALALATYSANDLDTGFLVMNRELRTVGVEGLSAKLKKPAALMDAALEKASVPEDVVAQRHVGIDAMQASLGVSSFDQIKPGMVYRDEGYTSVTMHTEHSHDERSFDLLVLVPKGTHGAYIDPMSSNTGECELLLARTVNSFRVVEIKGTQIVVVAESDATVDEKPAAKPKPAKGGK